MKKSEPQRVKLIDFIAGARPNFMKIAPIIHAIQSIRKKETLLKFRLIHTGQHYDKNMSADFFEQLEIPNPDFNLGVGSGTQAEQTAGIMVGYEKILQECKSDLCLVVGDVTSTMACSIVAQKMQIPVAHVEGGIRSGDWTMPEEINRMVTDAVTNWFFTTSETANNFLRNSGVPENRIFFVGNTMIDTLLGQIAKFKKPLLWEQRGLQEKKYFVLTLHRPSNVDNLKNLKEMIETILECSKGLQVVFPVHPRTAKNMKKLGMFAPNLILLEPLGYLEFNYLVKNACAVLTDSGGITEEATILGIPCMTLRNNTERPETVTMGTNELIGTNPKKFHPFFESLFSGKWKKGKIPRLWDGQAGLRIVDHLFKLLF
jgi:UDP-N-acetylglucosamine 2-epimerase (non-hydrolysing)